MQKSLDKMSLAELQSLQERTARAKVAAKRPARQPKAVSDNIARRMKIGGGKVVDGLRALDIRITKEDVRSGTKKNASSCAAAMALCREGFTAARVHAARTYVQQPDGAWLRYATPLALRNEIIAFDRGGTFEPGAYHLPPINPSERIGARAKRKGAANKDKGRYRGPPKRKNHITTGVRSRFLPD